MIVNDWKKIIKIGISFWLVIFTLICYAGPELVYKYFEIHVDPVLLWYLGLFSVIGIGFGRLVIQDRSILIEILRVVAIIIIVIIVSFIATFVSNNQAYANELPTMTVTIKETKALDVAVPLIARWEGLRLDAYLDIVDVPTICYGSTRGITLGMSKTQEQCDDLLREEVSEYRHGWLEYVEPYAYYNYLPPKRDAAYTSLAYNIGIRGAGKSTATRRLNRGDIRGGCIALSWFNKAGNRIIRGLVNRRKDEVNLCLNA